VKLRPATDVLVEVLADELVVLRPPADLHLLDPAAVVVWHAFEGANTVEGAIARLVEVYDGDPAAIARDVRGLCTELVSLGLLEVM
jgi:Coenzyme PQQ synthesis protein D (PqqD)